MPSRRDVRETYDRIASHFAETRHSPWDEVTTFLAERSGTLGIDVGCGNGRHTEELSKRTDRTIGLDASVASLGEAAIRLAGNERISLLQADAVDLPLRTRSVNVALYIATIHHLPRRSLRVASLDELARVLVPGGTGLVSAWSVSHDRFEESTAFDTTVDWTLPDGERVPRYYHIYDLESFEADLGNSELGVERVFEAGGNCYGIVKG